MIDDALYHKIQPIREEYRKKMNSHTEAAQRAAAEERMNDCSENSTAAERYREAFMAINRIFKALDQADSLTHIHDIKAGES